MDSEKKLEEDVVEQPSTCSESSLSTVTADTENDMLQGELSEYECQYLGFTPKSLINGGKILKSHVYYCDQFTPGTYWLVCLSLVTCKHDVCIEKNLSLNE